MLGRDQSPPTAILMYRLQHGLRSRPPSSTLQLGTPAVLRLFQFQFFRAPADGPNSQTIRDSLQCSGASLGG